MRAEIDCINKNPREDPYHAIKFVGGPNGDGTRWKLPLDAAVRGAQQGTYDFFVRQADHTVEVIVARSAAGNYYLKTEADGDTPDNLLSLRECQ